MHSLVEPLLATGEVELAVATSTAAYPECRFEEAGVTYFNTGANRVLEAFNLFPRSRLRQQLSSAEQIVSDWKPDVVHVHGSERFFGLLRARGQIDVPTVVSIQGLIERYHRVCLGAMNLSDLIRHITLHDLSRNASPIMVRRRWGRQIPIEQEIVCGADAIIGRTVWDRAHTRAQNPAAPYFHVDEMMRPEFHSSKPWSIDSSDPHTIMSTSGKAPLKGLSILLEAIAILRRWGNPVRLKVAGVPAEPSKSGLVRFLHQRINELNINDAVELLGYQLPERLANFHRHARCYVTPSFIENSSNALCEAQLVGVPCVASYAGGTPAIIRDGQTGLLFCPGDSAMLARQIEQILTDDKMAKQLGSAGRDEALNRHDPQRIIGDLLECYRTMASTSLGDFREDANLAGETAR